MIGLVSDSSFNTSHVLVKDFEFGAAKLKKGCEIGFQIPFEASSYDSVEKQRSARTISYIRCQKTGFKLGGAKLLSASFDFDGCIESPVFLFEPVKICGNTWPNDQELQFKKGRIKCPGR